MAVTTEPVRRFAGDAPQARGYRAFVCGQRTHMFLASKARSHYESATGRIRRGEPGTTPGVRFSANGAAFTLSLGQRPRDLGSKKTPALKARFTFGASLAHD